ncbi:MAG: hypothetical protein L6420_09160 [Elusimicrobia bacterium]|nr:hypothetical protein [Elusimicrobiota bacterium]
MKFFLILFFFVSPLYASITDTPQELIIPQNETYVLIGSHSYTNQIKIDGILYIGGYNGSAESGRLDLISPSINISSTGKILADGRGYEGGPGKGITGWKGSGGGYGGVGGKGESVLGGGIYGSIVEPLELGSGGGASASGDLKGGAGGGLIKLEVGNILRVDGEISANGIGGKCSSWYPCGASGSGGSVYIVTNKLEGVGTISANGGYQSIEVGGGGGGRIMINAANSTDFTGEFKAHGGTSGNSASYGGAGTIYFTIQNKLIIDNSNITGADTPFLDGQYNFSEIIISSKASVTISSGVNLECNSLKITDYGKITSAGSILITSAIIGGEVYINSSNFNANVIEVVDKGILYLNNSTIANDVNIYSGGVITHNGNVDKFDLKVANNLDIKQGGKIIADGRGYGSNSGPGKGLEGVRQGSGGGYGGKGGKGDNNVLGGEVYGSIAEPLELGSGGGKGRYSNIRGGAGGGLIKLEVGNILRVNGAISSNGVGGNCNSFGSCNGAGGSGGSMYIVTNNLEGNGTIAVNGGQTIGEGGGGGGGRIGIFYNTKQFNGNILSLGGGGSSLGEKGTVLENGEIKSISPISATASIAIAQAAETIGSERYLTETLQMEKISAQSMITTGTLNGTFNFNEFEIIKIKTGNFQETGIIKAKWQADLNGVNYGGELKGIVFNKESKTYIKGTFSDEINGVAEGEMDGVNLRFKLNFNRLGTQIMSGKLYLTGTVNQPITVKEYPQVELKLIQKNIKGNMTGYMFYAGHVNAVFTYIKFGEGSDIYKDKGIFIASYETSRGNAQGWSYAKEIIPGVTTLEGFIDNPSYGHMRGALNENMSPQNLLINIERLDAGLSPETDLSVILTGPGTASPGGILSYSIQMNNDGLKAVENMSIIAIAPQHTGFISASGNYAYYDVARWIDGKYASTPFIKWGLSVIEPKSKIELNYQVKVRIGVAGPHEPLKGNVYIVPKTIADDIFAGFKLYP